MPAHVIGGKRQAHHLVEEGCRLAGREAQVVGAQLDQLIAGPHTGEGQGRVGAGEDHEMHMPRQVVEDKVEGFMDRLGTDRHGNHRARARMSR